MLNIHQNSSSHRDYTSICLLRLPKPGIVPHAHRASPSPKLPCTRSRVVVIQGQDGHDANPFGFRTWKKNMGQHSMTTLQHTHVPSILRVFFAPYLIEVNSDLYFSATRAVAEEDPSCGSRAWLSNSTPVCYIHPNSSLGMSWVLAPLQKRKKIFICRRNLEPTCIGALPSNPNSSGSIWPLGILYVHPLRLIIAGKVM